MMNRQLFSICLFVANFFNILNGFSLFKQKLYRNTRVQYGPCYPNSTRYPFHYFLKELYVAGGIDSITFANKFEILEDLHAPFTVTAILQKCAINGDGCENYKTLKFPNFCNSNTADISPLANFTNGLFSHTKPPLGCPVQKKGIYVNPKMKIDMSPLAIFPLEGYRWKLKTVFCYGETAEPLMCSFWDLIVVLAAKKRDGSKKSN